MGNIEETDVAVETGEPAVDLIVAEAVDPADKTEEEAADPAAVEEAGLALEEVEVQMDSAMDTLD